MPTGRAMANGSVAVLIIAVLGYCSGRGAARALTITVGGAAAASSVGSAGSAQSTGWWGSNYWLVAGGSYSVTFDMNGSAYFGRGGGGSCSDSYGTSWSGTLGGGYRYVQAPSAPQGLVLALTGVAGEVQASWSAPADNGGAGVSGYRITHDDNAGYSSPTNTDDTASPLLISGLTPGSTLYAKVAAKNAVTDAAGTVGVYSATASVFIPSGGKVWDGAAFVPGNVKVWDGAAFVDGQVKVWDGAAFVPAQ